MNIVDILNPDRVIMLGKTVDELKGNKLYRLQRKLSDIFPKRRTH